MKHSKHLTVFVSLLLSMLLAGAIAYLYLVYVGASVEDADTVSDAETNVSGQAAVTQEAIMRLQTPSPGTGMSEEEKQAAIDRLQEPSL